MKYGHQKAENQTNEKRCVKIVDTLMDSILIETLCIIKSFPDQRIISYKSKALENHHDPNGGSPKC